jgi:N utilization substance protein B
MLNRRHLRIKVLQILYAYFQTEDKDPKHAEKELFKSIDKMYDLYLLFLMTFEELVQFGEQRIEDRQKKIRPTEEDLQPNRKFVDNVVFQHFINNLELKKNAELRKVNWRDAVKNDLMRKLFVKIVETEAYKEYMTTDEVSHEEAKKFALTIFRSEIANFELLHDFFESESIYWLDDIDLVCSMVLKTMKTVKEDSSHESPILPLFKENDDEKEFITLLVRKTIEKDEGNSEEIDALTQNWELDRIAKMDIILLKMALTELTELSSIPKKVTLNEYIEISKFYSTPKSQVFINGVLDKAVAKYEKEGKLNKVGRGLIN